MTSLWGVGFCNIIEASLSEPHIDEFAVNFPYNYIYLFLYIYRTSCRKSLPARILRVIASCVNSNHKRTHHCNINDLDTNHERSTSTRMETIAHGEGLKHFMKKGRVLQAISCPACRAHHGVH